MKKLINYLLNKEWILNIVILFFSDYQKERIAIEKFRNELTLFGHDISDMTDEEIKEGITKVGDLMRRVGFTAIEAANALRGIKPYGRNDEEDLNK